MIERIADSKQELPDAFEVQTDHIQYDSEGNMDLSTLTEVTTSNSFKMSFLRSLRDKEIKDTIWIAESHLTQPAGSETLTDVEYQEWQTYWQQLRDLPANTNVSSIALPDIPGVLPARPTGV